MHCAGEDSSARIGEDGINKCRTGVSPKKTMEEVSAGFGVAFLGKYESGDFEEDYEDMEDDPSSPPSSSPSPPPLLLLFPFLSPSSPPSSYPSSPPSSSLIRH